MTLRKTGLLFFDKLRSVHAKRIFAFALLLSVIVVAGALPGRQEGSRSATDAYIPLKSLTPEEAAFLLESSKTKKHPHTVVIGVEGNEVLLGTRVFVVRDEVADTSHGEWLDQERAPYRMSSATWEKYSCLYRLPRMALEKALGYSLDATEFVPDFLIEYPVSFSPQNLWRYVLTEVAFLSTWLTIAIVCLLRIKHVTAIFPLLTLILLIPMIFVPIYSPAFYDADWFHQRIVVESIALACAYLELMIFLPALISLAAYSALRLTEWIARRRGVSLTKCRSIAAVSLVVIGIIYLLLRYVAYSREATACEADLERAVNRVQDGTSISVILDPELSLPREQNLLKCPEVPPLVQNAISQVLTPNGDRAHRQLVVLVPNTGPDGEHLFLWRNGFFYADFRRLGPRFGNLINAELLTEAHVRGHYATGFHRVFSGNHLCGQALQVRGREVIVAIE